MLKKKSIIALSVVALAAGLLPFSSDAAVLTKTIQAKYNNIKVKYNGTNVQTDLEPFLVNGTTYIPVRMMAGVFNKNITWDGNTYTINVSDKPDSTVSSLQADIAQKDSKIASLEAQLKKAQNEIDDLEAELDDKDNSDDIDEVIDDMESALNDDHGDFKDLEWDISLDGDEEEIEVTIEIDFADYEDDWDELTETQIKGFVNDILSDIWDDSDLEDADITGTIVDSDEDDDLVEFEADAGEKATFEFK
ncbi:MAG: stalk domain-containing protein [Clostridia bacterium]